MGTVFKTLYPKVAKIEMEKGRKKDTFPAICYMSVGIIKDYQLRDLHPRNTGLIMSMVFFFFVPHF